MHLFEIKARSLICLSVEFSLATENVIKTHTGCMTQPKGS